MASRGAKENAKKAVFGIRKCEKLGCRIIADSILKTGGRRCPHLFESFRRVRKMPIPLH